MTDRSRGRDYRFRSILGRLKAWLLANRWPLDGSYWEADHTIPLSLGGPEDPENIRTLCLRCHRDATARRAHYASMRRRLRRENFPHSFKP